MQHQEAERLEAARVAFEGAEFARGLRSLLRSPLGFLESPIRSSENTRIFLEGFFHGEERGLRAARAVGTSRRRRAEFLMGD